MSALYVRVEISSASGELLRAYTMNHDDPVQRRVLGQQCRFAFEVGQRVTTYRVDAAA